MGLQEKKEWVESLFTAVRDCKKDDIKKYLKLLKKELLDPNSITNENNLTILGFACSVPSPCKENVELIDFLIKECGIPVSDPQAGPNASTALMCAISSDTEGDHKPFVDKLFNYENLSKRDKHLALLYYSGIGDLEKVEYCLSTYQYDVNFNHKNLGSPLSRSVRNGQDTIVKKLLECPNIKVNTTNLYGETLLIEAIENQHAGIAQLLLNEKGDDLDIYAQSPFLGTPLTAAIFYRQHDLVCRLLEEEESFDDKEHPGALLCAIRNDDVDTIKILLEKGANVNVTGQKGYEEPDNNQILHENRVSPFFSALDRDPVFDLPIIVAIKERKLEALKAILEFNPDLTKKGQLGDTAEELAWHADTSKDVKDILKQHLAHKQQHPKTHSSTFWQASPLLSPMNYHHCYLGGDTDNDKPSGKVLPATLQSL
jgi:ankyrin repeat protein